MLPLFVCLSLWSDHCERTRRLVFIAVSSQNCKFCQASQASNRKDSIGVAALCQPSMRWKRGNAESSPKSIADDVPAVGITPHQKTLEEALVTVASWDRLMGTEEEEEGEAAGYTRSWPPKPQRPAKKESMNLPLFVRASQECVTSPAHTGRRLSHGAPPSPSGARAPNSPASPAILSQQQWLAAELKRAEADDLSVTPPKDLKQRSARAWKPPVVLRQEFPPVELPPAQTQAVESGPWSSQQPRKPIGAHTRRAGLGCLLAAALILLVQVRAPDAPPRRTDVAEGGRLYGPLIAAGDAAVLSAQGVLRLCKAEKRRAALSHLTPTQRRKLGSDVAIWLASFASLALPSSPLVVLGRAPARVLASRVTVLRSAVFASRVPPAAATFATVAMGGAAKAGVGASTRAAAAAAAAAAATAAAKAGVATLPASLLGSPAAAKTNHLVLELTRRTGAKFLLLDVRLPSAVNPVTRRVLASFPGLAY